MLFSLYGVLFPLYGVLFSLYGVLFPLYGVLFSLYGVLFSLYGMLFSMACCSWITFTFKYSMLTGCGKKCEGDVQFLSRPSLLCGQNVELCSTVLREKLDTTIEMRCTLWGMCIISREMRPCGHMKI